MYTFLVEILPRAQQKEDILLSVHVPTSLDAVSVSLLYSSHFLRLLFTVLSLNKLYVTNLFVESFKGYTIDSV